MQSTEKIKFLNEFVMLFDKKRYLDELAIYIQTESFVELQFTAFSAKNRYFYFF